MPAGPQVLLIDPNAMFRAVVKEAIARYYPSVDVLEAGDVDQALRLAKEHRLQFILVDLHLKGKHGLEFTRWLRAQQPDSMLMVLADSEEPEYHEALHNAEVDHFRSKAGLTSREVIDMIRESLEAN